MEVAGDAEAGGVVGAGIQVADGDAGGDAGGVDGGSVERMVRPRASPTTNTSCSLTSHCSTQNSPGDLP